jgi:hypothetical protein
VPSACIIWRPGAAPWRLSARSVVLYGRRSHASQRMPPPGSMFSAVPLARASWRLKH